MNATERTARIIGGAAVAITAVLLVACAKPEPTPEPVRPVQLMQVKLGGTTGTAVFAGSAFESAAK